ncbi:MAG: thermonuclease family protein [Fibrobacterales bacterium]|nr:thermonuclease family protein [Fibrobacterales bacterium]
MKSRSRSVSPRRVPSRRRIATSLTTLLVLLVVGLIQGIAQENSDGAIGKNEGPSEQLSSRQTKKQTARQLKEEMRGAKGDTLRGRAVKVQDGDTFDFLYGDNRKQRVRVAQMDAPEKNMPFGQKSKERFTELVMGKEIALVVNTVDRYGRIVGSVVIDGEDQSARMISEGMAWYYRQYGWTDSLARLEEEARNAKRGLWADPNPQPPWEWRKENRGKKKNQ